MKHRNALTIILVVAVMLVAMTSVAFAETKTVTISQGAGAVTSPWTTTTTTDVVYSAENTGISGNSGFYAKAISSSSKNTNGSGVPSGGTTRRTSNMDVGGTPVTNITANSGQSNHYWRLCLDPYYFQKNAIGNGSITTN